MNIGAIIRFRDMTKGTQVVVPSGISLYQGHIVLTYPEFRGKKEDMIDYYEKELSPYSPSQVNDVLHTLIGTVKVIKKEDI